VVAVSLKKAPFPAASAAVWRGGGLVWSEAFGMANLETRLPARPDDRFRLASVSKVLTGAAVMRLAERGAIDLDVPIARYRPDLPAHHQATTLRQLASHQGGVRHYIPRDFDPAAPGGPIDGRTYATTEDKLAIFIDDPLVSAPGEAVHYSSFGFVLLGAVLESAVGKPFPAILADEVTGPLALASIAPEVRGRAVADRVSDYQPVYPALTDIVRCPPINPAYKWPAGGLLGAAPDVARFAGALTRPGYLGVAAMAQMLTGSPLRSGGAGPFGISWDLDQDSRGRRRAWHAGSIAGGRSIIMMLPDEGAAVAVLTNLGQIDVDPLTPAQQIAEAFLD
ncbi:MAG TPA: serine hydrolase domain-containing protein, partial [Caulobacter sp.]|nr:serine hydrolase domain-containing protein [Caulobacter sp.]